MKNALQSIFKENQARGESIKPEDKALNINTLTDNNDETLWNPDKKEFYSFELTLKSVSEFDVQLLQENIRIG